MVIPAEVRAAVVEHAEAERPNEACGLIVLRDGVAERYVPGTNAASSAKRLLDEKELAALDVPQYSMSDVRQRIVDLFKKTGGEPAPDEVHAVLISLLGRFAGDHIFHKLRDAARVRFSLEVSPDTWYLEDQGYELAVFHSHLSSPPRPSPTDVENIGLWEGRPYVILNLQSGELAAWRIHNGAVRPDDLS